MIRVMYLLMLTVEEPAWHIGYTNVPGPYYSTQEACKAAGDYVQYHVKQWDCIPILTDGIVNK